MALHTQHGAISCRVAHNTLPTMQLEVCGVCFEQSTWTCPNDMTHKVPSAYHQPPPPPIFSNTATRQSATSSSILQTLHLTTHRHVSMVLKLLHNHIIYNANPIVHVLNICCNTTKHIPSKYKGMRQLHRATRLGQSV